MSECLDRKCIECKDHAVVRGIVVCNKGNRMGIRASVLEKMLGGEDDS